jgi:hypothetical protein
MGIGAVTRYDSARLEGACNKCDETASIGQDVNHIYKVGGNRKRNIDSKKTNPDGEHLSEKCGI